MSEEESGWSCARKAMQMPAVRSAWDAAGHLYGGVKGSNALVGFAIRTLETGVQLAAKPALWILQKPINAMDIVACKVLDGVMNVFPTVLESPSEALKSGGMQILSFSITQKAMYGVDRVLFVAEKVTTILPEVTLENAPEDEVNADTFSVLSYILHPIKMIYSYATAPLRLTTRFLQARRENVVNIRRLVRNDIPSPEVAAKIQARRKVTPRKRLPHVGLKQKIIGMPWQMFKYVGVLAQERSTLTMYEDPDIYQIRIRNSEDGKQHLHDMDPSSTTRANKARKRPITSIDSPLLGPTHQMLSSNDSSSSEASLTTIMLSNLESYDSTLDPDYQPGETSDTDSLEYNTSNGSACNSSSPEKITQSPLSKSTGNVDGKASTLVQESQKIPTAKEKPVGKDTESQTSETSEKLLLEEVKVDQD